MKNHSRCLMTFILCAFAIVSFAQKPQGGQSKWDIPYYPRKLSGKTYAILCLTNRLAKNKLMFGHSALSIFPVTPSKTKAKTLTSSTVKTAGFWPRKQPDDNDPEGEKHYLSYNNPQDHFLTFQEGSNFATNSKHCVPITKAEATKLNEFLEANKKKTWLVGYNCNDLSSDAFSLVTGITFSEKKFHSILNPTCPQHISVQIQTYQAKLGKAPESFQFWPNAEEVEKIRFIEKSVPLNHDVLYKAPVKIKEVSPTSEAHSEQDNSSHSQ